MADCANSTAVSHRAGPVRAELEAVVQTLTGKDQIEQRIRKICDSMLADNRDAEAVMRLIGGEVAYASAGVMGSRRIAIFDAAGKRIFHKNYPTNFEFLMTGLVA